MDRGAWWATVRGIVMSWTGLEHTGAQGFFPDGPAVKNLSANARDIVQFLVQKDPTCHSADKPMCHNY